MNRQRADLAAGLLVAAAVAVGLLFTWDAYRQRQAFEGMGGGGMMGSGMMDSMMGTPDPLWYLLGTLIVGTVLGGGYLLLRPELPFDGQTGRSVQWDDSESADGDAESFESVTGAEDGESVAGSGDGESATSSEDGESADGAEAAATSILEVLPDDERRILEPVVEDPGLTQIALRDRSDFSKSKVSQTVSELEKRGLLYRERQGRTFRVYPAEDLER